jgi:hypothetical protein
MVCGPSSLAKAKGAAMAMAKGAVGDYRIANAVTHLNGLTARLSERFGSVPDENLDVPGPAHERDIGDA